jgi:hypothetical protein
LAKLKDAKKLLKSSGIFAPVMEVPKEVYLPDRNGYLISYTHEVEIALKVASQLRYLCESYNIPLSDKYYGGAVVKLKLERIGFDTVSQVAFVDAMCQIYRGL